MQSAMATDYAAVVSPRNGTADEAQRYARLAADTAAAIGSFSQSTRAIMQKMLVLGTAQDSTANHQELRELTIEGNALVGRVERSLHELRALSAAPGAESPRRRSAQVDALASDFQSQCWNFEDTCRRLIEAERAAIAHLRQHASRCGENFGDGDAARGRGLDLANYDEEKPRAAASVDQDELERPDQEVLLTNHHGHTREASSRSREPSELVAHQSDVLVDVAKDTEQTNEFAGGALASEGERRMRCGGCSRAQLVLVVTLVLLVAVLALVLGLK
ncbi:hypothetical protein PybrP1_001503 [[Pythium] brassicae (nom. inval.)]|nr:hypothetical protein PybrP1_001503 [[Pythium] brassicae (nom. inval.)]